MFGFFKKREDVFHKLIQQQASITYEGLRLLVKYLETQNGEIAEQLDLKEKEADEVRRILIDGIVASNVSPDHGILIVGLPRHPIEDVVLSNLQFHYLGGGTVAQAARVVPEFQQAYPDPHVFGIMPSWGVFARHVKNLRLRDVELRVLTDDQRPAVVFDDVVNAQVFNVQLTGVTALPLWIFEKVLNLSVETSTGLPEDPLPAVLPPRIEF